MGPYFTGDEEINTTDIELAVGALTEVPDNLMSDLAGNAEINENMEALEGLLGFEDDWNGTAIAAMQEDEAVWAALTALIESEDGPTDE